MSESLGQEERKEACRRLLSKVLILCQILIDLAPSASFIQGLTSSILVLPFQSPDPCRITSYLKKKEEGSDLL